VRQGGGRKLKNKFLAACGEKRECGVMMTTGAVGTQAGRYPQASRSPREATGLQVTLLLR
jgi:hypothetical protein